MFSLLKEATPQELIDIRSAWGPARDVVIKEGDSRVKGSMSNLISILDKAGWNPRAVNRWEDDTGATWVLNLSPTSTSASSPPDVVASNIISSSTKLDLVRAESDYNGKGMGNGVHFGATLALLRSLKPSQYSSKCLLENVLSASNWIADRIHGINLDFRDLCQRCGEVEAPFHCYWGCPAHHNIEDDAVKHIQKYIAEAAREVDNERCLWLRGILLVSIYL